jgi:hypothetical protein
VPLRTLTAGILCLGRSAGLHADTDTDILLRIRGHRSSAVSPVSGTLEARYSFHMPGERQEIEGG